MLATTKGQQFDQGRLWWEGNREWRVARKLERSWGWVTLVSDIL